jgi:FdhD protein
MPQASRQTTVTRFPAGEEVSDRVAVEEPLQIRLHGEALAVLMRTPGLDRALVAGFLLAEGVIESVEDIRAIAPCPDAENTLLVELREGCPWDPEAVRRTALATSSCGVCGKTSIDNLLDRIEPLSGPRPLPRALVASAGDRAMAEQRLFRETGGIHAAALLSLESHSVLSFAEDVGRHNAIDKVVGQALLAGLIPVSGHALWVSGRASFEVIQKALVAQVDGVICVGAPSSMAVELAGACGLTLIGFCKDGERYNLYAGQVAP